MPRLLVLRPLIEEEAPSIHRLAHARTAPARAVERAQIVWRAHQGERVPAIAQALGRSDATIRLWLMRFSAQGIAGLRDGTRAGRPPTCTPEASGKVVATSLTKPDNLGLPFGSWTLDRLAAYRNEARNIPIRRSRIGAILQAEGLRGQTQETWFDERVAPEVAA